MHEYMRRRGGAISPLSTGESVCASDRPYRALVRQAFPGTLAEKLMVHDVLGAHILDEPEFRYDSGLAVSRSAIISSRVFGQNGVGILTALVTSTGFDIGILSVASSALLVVVGAVGARAGGARTKKFAIHPTY